MNKQCKTILIIEDEEILRQSLSDFLEDRKFRVLTAENSREGLAIYKREQPDLVLTDLGMPGTDNLDALTRAGELSPGTPLIVVSGTGHIGEVVRALRLGAWDYILKPIGDMSVISHTVEKALERSRLIQENHESQMELERKVSERTRELEVANANLSGINERLRKVVETTRSLSACHETSVFGFRLLEGFASHMQATGGSLYLIENNGLRRVHTLDSGHTPEFIPFPLPVDSVFQRTIERGEPLLIEDSAKDSHFRSSGWEGYPDGSLLCFPLSDEQGETVGVLTLHSKTRLPFGEQDREIGAILTSYSSETLRAVRAVEDLREGERRFRELVELLPDVVFETDVNNRLTFANRKAFELFGYTQADLDDGLGLLAMVIPEERPQLSDRFAQRLKGEDLGREECTGLARDGKTFPVLLHTSPIQRKGKCIGLRGIIIDISERKKSMEEKEALQDQLNQAQKMEAVGRLAGGVAHDFNNMLGVILGHSEMALERLDTVHPIHADLDEIRKAAQRSADLTRQLLAFARKQTVTPKVLNLNETVSGMLKMLGRLIGEDIELSWQPGADLWQIHMDPSQIDQILANLCVNARDAITADGKISIGTANKVLQRSQLSEHLGVASGEYVQLTFSDNGCGMDKETLSHIYEPFFTTKEMGKGTGLGLATIYGVVKQNNGFIEVSSKPGQGTTFRIFLPRHAVLVEQCPEESTAEISPPAHETILLVEDDPTILKMTEMMLKQMGYDVLAANTPGEAVRLAEARSDQIHLLITDVIMPEMNGRDLARNLLAIHPGLKHLFMSGYTADVIAHRGVLDEGVHFIQKPFSKKDLAVRIREALEQG